MHREYNVNCPTDIGDNIYVPFYPPLKVIKVIFIIAESNNGCDYGYTIYARGPGGVYIFEKDEYNDSWFINEDAAKQRKKTWIEDEEWLNE